MSVLIEDEFDKPECDHDWLGPTDDFPPICRKCEKVMTITEQEGD